jgi:hypothetical protein
MALLRYSKRKIKTAQRGVHPISANLRRGIRVQLFELLTNARRHVRGHFSESVGTTSVWPTIHKLGSSVRGIADFCLYSQFEAGIPNVAQLGSVFSSTCRLAKVASSARLSIARRVALTIVTQPITRPATPTMPDENAKRAMTIKAACRAEPVTPEAAARFVCGRCGHGEELNDSGSLAPAGNA